MALDSLPVLPPLGPQSKLTATTLPWRLPFSWRRREEGPSLLSLGVHCDIFAACGRDLTDEVLLHQLSGQARERLTSGAWAFNSLILDVA